jgi:hypothetical protein
VLVVRRGDHHRIDLARAKEIVGSLEQERHPPAVRRQLLGNDAAQRRQPRPLHLALQEVVRVMPADVADANDADAELAHAFRCLPAR